MMVKNAVISAAINSSSSEGFIGSLLLLAHDLAVAQDRTLGSRSAGFLGHALDHSVVVTVLVVLSLPEDEVQVLTRLALIEMGLVDLRYVDGYANHVCVWFMVY